MHPYAGPRRPARVAFISVHGCPVARLGERETGGMNVYLLQVAKALGRQGVAVDVFTRCHDPNDPRIVPLGPGARVIHLKAGPYNEPKEGLYRYLPQFLNNLLSFAQAEGLDYQVVHSHYWLSGWVGLFLSRQWGVPHATTFHTLAEVKQRAQVGNREPQMRAYWEREIMASAGLVLAFSDHERDAMAQWYQVPRDRIRVLPAGVDTDLFKPHDDPEACKRALGLDGKRVLLYVGRIEPIKGVDVLLRAVAQLEPRDDVQLVIVGGKQRGDREVGRLRRLAQRLELGDAVRFVGTVRQEELACYYSSAEALVLPSHYESFGLVALEAMASGTPVVASRVGGLPTFVRDGETGYLIPWRCPEGFTERLEVILHNEWLRECLGRAGRRRALEMSWNRVAERLQGLYLDLVEEPWIAAAGG